METEVFGESVPNWDIIELEADMYHLSDIKKFLRCDRLYCYGKGEENVFRPFLHSDENIIDLLKEYFGIGECFTGIRNDENDRFFSSRNDYEWFIRPRFVDGLLRLNVPLMHRVPEGYDLYFLYYGTQIRELDTVTLRATNKVMERLNVPVNRILLIYFNEEYTYHGKLDVQELFLVTDRFRDKTIISIVEDGDFDYDSLIRRMERYEIDEKAPVKSRTCRQNGLCEFYDRCFPEEEKTVADSILTLVSSRFKRQMYNDGRKLLKDADPSLIEGNRVQYAQIMASRNGGVFLDANALGKWLEKLEKRPISFIDFEWDRYLVPAYENMRPMDPLCFEFALYYIDEEGHMEHRTFVATGDCRKDFIEGLLMYLPSSGPILAYNAYGAECLRLKELSEMFPEYRERLEKLIERFVDLATPFNEGLVYDVNMEGNFTLKKLVDICSEYSYTDLDIYDGMEAVYSWRDIGKDNGVDEQKILSDLEEYCSLDAYGLFLVYRWLIKLMLESNKQKEEDL